MRKVKYPSATSIAAAVTARWLLVAMLGVAPFAPARSEELVTDRPDQTESAATVPPRALQIETGLLRVEAESERVDELGATLVRIGLAADWELRLAAGGWIDEHGTSGWADAAVGAKWRFLPATAGGTSAALLVSTSLPTGASAQSSDRLDPELRLSVAHPLGERLSLAWNAGVAGDSELDATGRRRSRSYLLATIALGVAASERAGLFVELFGEGGGSRGGPPRTALDAGVTWLWRENLQLDLAAGVGMSRAAPDRFVGVGLSARFPR